MGGYDGRKKNLILERFFVLKKKHEASSKKESLCRPKGHPWSLKWDPLENYFIKFLLILKKRINELFFGKRAATDTNGESLVKISY